MPLFGPYVYVNKKKEKFYLHAESRGKRVLYYFTKEPAGALSNLPPGLEVFENPKSNIPMLRKKKPSIFSGILPNLKKEKE